MQSSLRTLKASSVARARVGRKTLSVVASLPKSYKVRLLVVLAFHAPMRLRAPDTDICALFPLVLLSVVLLLPA